jgi:hypothetical protein
LREAVLARLLQEHGRVSGALLLSGWWFACTLGCRQIQRGIEVLSTGVCIQYKLFVLWQKHGCVSAALPSVVCLFVLAFQGFSLVAGGLLAHWHDGTFSVMQKRPHDWRECCLCPGTPIHSA